MHYGIKGTMALPTQAGAAVVQTAVITVECCSPADIDFARVYIKHI